MIEKTAGAQLPAMMTEACVPDVVVTPEKDLHLGDIKCWVISSATLSNNRLILADVFSKSLKLIYTHSAQILAELHLKSAPGDITDTNKDEAVVSLPDKHKLLFLVVTDSITKRREVSVGGRCHGLAFANEQLFVTFTDKPKLKIMNTGGQVIRTLERGETGALLFEGRPQHVCVSQDCKTIYVNDVDNRGVVSLTMDGVVKSVYRDIPAFLPQKMCTDRHGNVFVCNYLGEIHILTADCALIKNIPIERDEEFQRIWSISYSQETNQLYISLWNCDKIKVYQLSYHCAS